MGLSEQLGDLWSAPDDEGFFEGVFIIHWHVVLAVQRLILVLAEVGEFGKAFFEAFGFKAVS